MTSLPIDCTVVEADLVVPPDLAVGGDGGVDVLVEPPLTYEVAVLGVDEYHLDSALLVGAPGKTGHQIVFGTQGPVAPKVGTLGYYPRVKGRITRVTAAVATQVSGTTRVDVNINGTTVFTNQTHRPLLASTGRHVDDADMIDAGAFTANDYFTADVDTAGVGTTDLIVTVDYMEE